MIFYYREERPKENINKALIEQIYNEDAIKLNCNGKLYIINKDIWNYLVKTYKSDLTLMLLLSEAS